MVIKRVQTSKTATATTATMTFGAIYGKILKVEVKNGTGSCGWWVYCTAGDGGNLINENILGATAGGHLDTAGAVYYPVTQQVINAGTATDPDQYSETIVGGVITVDVDDCANAEVLTCVIWYEPITDVY